ncbi:MAG: hypothetical protein HY919_03010 [Elusimicrobia bacterium]|nr:hypothetical protein [Elusimicrobiota bacterium]
MKDPINIEHPYMQEIKEEYESRISELEEQIETKESEFDELRSNGESSIEAQLDFLQKIIRNKDGKITGITLDEFRQSLNGFSLKSYQTDWSILSGLYEILENIKPEKEIIEKVIVQYKEILPQELKINNSIYTKSSELNC